MASARCSQSQRLRLVWASVGGPRQTLFSDQGRRLWAITRPPNIFVGGRKGKCPPTDCPFSKKKFLIIRHFSGSLQNAYLGEELKGVLYYQNSISFQLQGDYAPLTS